VERFHRFCVAINRHREEILKADLFRADHVFSAHNISRSAELPILEPPQQPYRQQNQAERYQEWNRVLHHPSNTHPRMAFAPVAPPYQHPSGGQQEKNAYSSRWRALVSSGAERAGTQRCA